jgi:hypothetical protein
LTRGRAQQRAAATDNRIADRSVLERLEETRRDDDDALRPIAGLAGGVLAGVVVWALIGAAVLAAYQFTPSSLAAMVQRVLLAPG